MMLYGSAGEAVEAVRITYVEIGECSRWFSTGVISRTCDSFVRSSGLYWICRIGRVNLKLNWLWGVGLC